ncbi:MAG: ATP-binding protein [Candidatus Paceibacterota bacterium]
MAKKDNSEAKKSRKYTADNIVVLEGLEPVRKRPGMYIGSTGPDGLHHLLVEIFDNARDEAMNGYADEIEVALLPDGAVRVVDNGNGIPVEIHKKTKVSTLETVMTVLHAGGKFGGDGYKISGGLHGVGASVVNALSEYLVAEVHRDGGKFSQEYKQGIKKAKVKKVASSKLSGTVITFKPDKTIFSETEYDWQRVVSHLRGQAYLVKGLRIRVIDARLVTEKINTDDVFFLSELGLEAPSRTFYFEGGLLSFVKFQNQDEKPVHKNIFYVEKEASEVTVEIALQYIDDISPREISYTNNTITPEGGMHLTGFRTALTRTLNDYARKNNLIKDKEENFTGDDVREGIVVVVSVKLRDPQFEGQTKAKLGSVEARSATDSVFGEAFSMFLEEHPEDAKQIIGKVTLALKARKAAKAAKDSVLRKGALEGLTLPGKLADCQTRDASESELFIVEGDSAGGCFLGDTKVALTDGREVSFKELVEEDKAGKQNYCYTISNDGRVAVGQIKHPRITKRNTEVIKVILDNEAEIECTPDHRFMLRDGSFRQARELKPDDSLMPLYRKVSEKGGRITIAGYEMVMSPGLNHRVKAVIAENKFADVYDIEVPGTHNFALAGGVFVHNSSKQGRDRRTQAILPLRGKILNVERARLDKMLASKEIKSLVIAIGAAIGDTFNIAKLRYHKIIIATDADVDGAHIRTLLLTLFYRYYKPLIEGGFIYVAQPPLYKIKKGKTVEYAYTEEGKSQIIKKLGANPAIEMEVADESDGEIEITEDEAEEKAAKSSKIGLQRYKGLGEMNPEELWETTMNPDSRVLKQVTINEAEEADKTFDVLMGNEVEPRRLFIQTHAKLAKVDV